VTLACLSRHESNQYCTLERRSSAFSWPAEEVHLHAQISFAWNWAALRNALVLVDSLCCVAKQLHAKGVTTKQLPATGSGGLWYFSDFQFERSLVSVSRKEGGLSRMFSA
jgi:hypothetical protein